MADVLQKQPPSKQCRLTAHLLGKKFQSLRKILKEGSKTLSFYNISTVVISFEVSQLRKIQKITGELQVIHKFVL
jgi:hypothetical protein